MFEEYTGLIKKIMDCRHAYCIATSKKSCKGQKTHLLFPLIQNIVTHGQRRNQYRSEDRQDDNCKNNSNTLVTFLKSCTSKDKYEINAMVLTHDEDGDDPIAEQPP